MTHLYLELDIRYTEEVSSAIISKLYELAISGDLDNTSNIKGRLHSSSGSAKKTNYLTSNFNELYITADVYTLDFEDPVWEQICIDTWGSNGMITQALMQSVSNLPSNLVSGNQDLRVIDLGSCTMNSNNWFNGKITNCPNVRKIIVGGESSSVSSKQSFKFMMSQLGITHLDKYILGYGTILAGNDIGAGSIDIVGIKNVSSIGSYLTRGNFTINKLYIWNTTPPSWSNGYGDDNSRISAVYVPIGYKQTYLNDAGFTSTWSSGVLEPRLYEYDFDTDPLGIFAELP